jgi:Subtilase family
MNPNRSPIRHRAAQALAIAAIVCGTVGVPGSAGAVNSTEVDTMAWLDDVSPAIKVDQTTDCMFNATDAVGYRNDRIVVRTSASNNSIKGTINSTLHGMYGPPNINYVGPIERITFPPPPSGPAFVDVVSVTLLPRTGSSGPHDILGLARHLRNDSGNKASPDYTYINNGPYSHYFPKGYPKWTAAVTPPRTNLTPQGAPVGAGLKIGTGVKIHVDDTGLFAADPVNLPTTTQLTSADNDLVDQVNNGPLMVDQPAAGHAQAIDGVLTTVAPGSAIVDVRINDRSGLITDVSAARAIASSLRSLTLPNYPNLLVNAFGGAVCDLNSGAAGGPVLQPVGMEAVVEVVDRFDPFKTGGMLIVASAGNEATTRPHFPAAFPSVLSVGALDGTIDGDLSPWSSPSKTAPVADFSNRGSTVDVYALGVELPTTHVNGYRFETGGVIIEGEATVSGTSFSGPKVAAYIAERMSTSGSTARAARDWLINHAIAPLPQCGKPGVPQGKAIVLTSLTASISDPATANPVTC